MLISVIIAAYNKPYHLDRVLTGYRNQNDKNFEIIIADDGSGAEVRRVVQKHKLGARFDIRHYWQEDDGFRKCKALNAATRMARGDYIMYTDDDFLPARNYVKMHRVHAKQGHYLIAFCNRLPQKTTDKITLEDIEWGNVYNPFWLAANGYFPTTGYARLIFPETIGKFLDARRHGSTKGFPGGSGSVFKSDFEKVGGFDENFTYGFEDQEFGYRLINAGVKPRRIKNCTYVLHLEHERDYAVPEEWERNHERMLKTINEGIAKIPYDYSDQRS